MGPNTSFGESSTATLRDRIRPAIVPLTGTNDVGRNRLPDVIAESIRAILLILRSRFPEEEFAARAAAEKQVACLGATLGSDSG